MAEHSVPATCGYTWPSWNSKQLTGTNLSRIAETMDLPASGSIADTRLSLRDD